MTPEQAAWVREIVWPALWLRNYNHIPGTFLDCACQAPPSVECQMGQHAQCRHDGRPIRETVIQTARGRAARFEEPYANPSAERSGINDLAWVWLTGPPCRQICNCPCHRSVSIPTTVVESEQLDLFSAATG